VGFIDEMTVAVTRRTPLPTPVPSPSVVATPTPTPTATVKPSAIVAASPLPTTTPQPAGPYEAVLLAMNARRADAGLAALTMSAVLRREAQEHADDMVARGFFDHTSPDGKTFSQRISESGYSYTAVAENIGLTSGNPVEVVALWMNSPPHRANMLDPRFVAAGVGIATGAYSGQSAVYIVAIFGDVR
jgi:uncharacterized protein YkwD